VADPGGTFLDSMRAEGGQGRPLELREVDPFIDTVREMVARQLVAGRPPILMVSRGVAMSVRTLQRRLADRGWSYSELVDDVRRVLARRRVAHLRVPFGEVASDLGFAEQASFTRAFRRWTGLTPREYRRCGGLAPTRPSVGQPLPAGASE